MKIEKIVKLFSEPRALYALLAWPKFSFTSYFMVSNLSKQGISPKTVVDVGANVGQFAVAAAKIFPDAKVYSFEPQPDCVKQIIRNVRSIDNIEVFPVGLGDLEGELDFYVNSHNHSSSLLPLAESHKKAFPGAEEVSQIRVKIKTLDKVIETSKLVSPCLLKLDVQGYELHVLRGAGEILKSIDYVLFETSFKALYEGETLFLEVIEIMKGFGFDFLRPVDWLADPQSGEVLQMDALFSKST